GSAQPATIDGCTRPSRNWTTTGSPISGSSAPISTSPITSLSGETRPDPRAARQRPAGRVRTLGQHRVRSDAEPRMSLAEIWLSEQRRAPPTPRAVRDTGGPAPFFYRLSFPREP